MGGRPRSKSMSGEGLRKAGSAQRRHEVVKKQEERRSGEEKTRTRWGGSGSGSIGQVRE